MGTITTGPDGTRWRSTAPCDLKGSWSLCGGFDISGRLLCGHLTELPRIPDWPATMGPAPQYLCEVGPEAKVHNGDTFAVVIASGGDGVPNEVHMQRYGGTGKWNGISFQRAIRMFTDSLTVEDNIYLLSLADQTADFPEG